MDNDKKYRIALVIKTDGLEYDDRVRKEIVTVKTLFPNISFKIFVILPENKETIGVTGYDTPFRSFYIKSRDKYPSNKKLVLKSYEFYRAIKDEIKDFDAIWCANDDTALIAALVDKNHLLWDLHEIPSAMLNSPVKRLLLKYIFSRCKVVVHANPQREEYLEGLGLISNPAKHFAIRNYPNFEDKDGNYNTEYYNFVKWKAERKCVYLQGLGDDGRSPYETISAVLNTNDLYAVVVGSFDNESKERLQKEYGKEFEDRVFFVGKIPQLKIPQYMEQCCMSLVFYKNIRPNNYYCEANRFYQAILSGLPVVVGNNPTMKELVDKYRFGISINDDGRDVKKIMEGINRILENYDYYQKNVINNKENLLWKKQDTEFKAIIGKLLE